MANICQHCGEKGELGCINIRCSDYTGEVTPTIMELFNNGMYLCEKCIGDFYQKANHYAHIGNKKLLHYQYTGGEVIKKNPHA